MVLYNLALPVHVVSEGVCIKNVEYVLSTTKKKMLTTLRLNDTIPVKVFIPADFLLDSITVVVILLVLL